jgi:hypothetical protein
MTFRLFIRSTPPIGIFGNIDKSLELGLAKANKDGFVKSPSAALRFIFDTAAYYYVRLVPQDSRALHPELFTVPSALMTSYEFINTDALHQPAYELTM